MASRSVRTRSPWLDRSLDASLTWPALHRRVLLWTCPAECDYVCQHMVTDKRLARDPPYIQPVYQFHGKWPFWRFLGMQEPFSVVFSLLNLAAHVWGMRRVRERIAPSYPLRTYYVLFGAIGLVTWSASVLFHARDFALTERLDYFAAAASVLYGLYYAPVRIFHLAAPDADRVRQSVLRLWTALCLLLYALHVCYLTLWAWDYTYNMAANVAVGIVQNAMWTAFSYRRYRNVGRLWAVWPGLIVAWLVLAMSLELLDFPPWRRMIDAHSLWHLGTVGPTVWWYKCVAAGSDAHMLTKASFLLKDAHEDSQEARLKA